MSFVPAKPPVRSYSRSAVGWAGREAGPDAGTEVGPEAGRLPGAGPADAARPAEDGPARDNARIPRLIATTVLTVAF